MSQFFKNQTEALKDCLQNSYSHDSIIKDLRYYRKESKLMVEAVNQFFHVGMNLTFDGVIAFLSINGNWPGDRDTIIALVVEEDYSFLKNCKQVCGDCFDNSLYLVFQMLSGDELHIVSKSVYVEII